MRESLLLLLSSKQQLAVLWFLLPSSCHACAAFHNRCPSGCSPFPPHATAAASAAGAPQSEFARRAAKIGMGIHSTSQKLQKLAQLARRTSMFDDPAEEISELSTVVKQDIQARRCLLPGCCSVCRCCSGPLTVALAVQATPDPSASPAPHHALKHPLLHAR